MNTLEDLKEATKRKKAGLFFIKSKHARPTYKNHPYFVTKNVDVNNKSSINSEKKPFVNEPTEYGIDNTFKYLYRNSLGN